MDLKVRITMTDETTEDLVTSSGYLDLASGEINRVEYDDHDLDALGHPWDAGDYEFTSGTLSHDGKDVEFKVDINKTTGQRMVSANELLEIKVRAAALFAGMSGKDLLGSAAAGRGAPPAGKPPARGSGSLH